ncbi:MAG: SMP-30/gluconolactonase/LRE family protein [Pyrinomonadaceae bacterium]|nr:SMP-30/gluconolactonase/LRE family protein [Pyrinomonadaceae bacterium]
MNRYLALGVFVVFLGTTLAVAQNVEVATTIAFTEGPTVDVDGNVFFTDQANNRIMKLGTDGKLSTFRHPANYANGLVFDPEWRLIACESGDKMAGTPTRVTRTDLKSGKTEILAEKYEGKDLVAPNDVTLDGKGRIYFSDKPATNTGEGGVYRIDPNGRVTRILAPPEIQVPNGLVISPDDKILYLVEANPGEKGARMIRAYDLGVDGTATNMRIFHNFYPGRSGDGMSIDVKGNLYVAAGLHRRRGTSETLDTKPGIHVFAPSGELLKFIPIPEELVTNCAFGGADLKTLYVTAGKTLFKVRTEIEGTRR